jgi:hypothetical protein
MLRPVGMSLGQRKRRHSAGHTGDHRLIIGPRFEGVSKNV